MRLQRSMIFRFSMILFLSGFCLYSLNAGDPPYVLIKIAGVPGFGADKGVEYRDPTADTTVLDIKQHLAQEINIPIEKMTFIFAGKDYDDNESVLGIVGSENPVIQVRDYEVPVHDRSFNVRVSVIDGSDYVFSNITPNTMVYDFKERVAKKMKSSAQQLKFFVDERECFDKKTISQCGIDHENNVLIALVGDLKPHDSGLDDGEPEYSMRNRILGVGGLVFGATLLFYLYRKFSGKKQKEK